MEMPERIWIALLPTTSSGTYPASAIKKLCVVGENVNGAVEYRPASRLKEAVALLKECEDSVQTMAGIYGMRGAFAASDREADLYDRILQFIKEVNT